MVSTKRTAANKDNDTGVIRPQSQPSEQISVLNKGARYDQTVHISVSFSCFGYDFFLIHVFYENNYS